MLLVYILFDIAVCGPLKQLYATTIVECILSRMVCFEIQLRYLVAVGSTAA